MSNKPEYYQQKYLEALEREERLVSFVQCVADGDYSDICGFKMLIKDASNVLEECKTLSGPAD